MNNGKIITLAQLAETIRQATGVPANEVEKFVVALTEEITRRLAAGEHVDVPGLGVFAVVNNNDECQIVWQPDNALQQEVNAPFAFFEPVELADGVTEMTLGQTLEQEAVNPQDNSSVDVPVESQQEPVVEVEAVSKESVVEVAPEPEPEIEPEPVAVTDETTEEALEEIVDEEPCENKGRFGWLELLLGLAIGLVVGFIAAVYSPNPQLTPIRSALSGTEEPATGAVDSLLEETASTLDALAAEKISEPAAQTAVPVDTVAVSPVQTQPVSKADRTDTVTSTRYLTTMARHYFGDYHFWVYIYLYNKDIISDPDRIPAGTVVRIPDASVYEIDASSPASVEKAQSLIESLKQNH